MDLFVGLLVTIISFDFMYKGWLMLLNKKKIILWPIRIILSGVSLILGPDVAKRREEIYLKKAWYYEISALIGGGLGFIGGLIFLVSAILRIA